MSVFFLTAAAADDRVVLLAVGVDVLLAVDGLARLHRRRWSRRVGDALRGVRGGRRRLGRLGRRRRRVASESGSLLLLLQWRRRTAAAMVRRTQVLEEIQRTLVEEIILFALTLEHLLLLSDSLPLLLLLPLEDSLEDVCCSLERSLQPLDRVMLAVDILDGENNQQGGDQNNRLKNIAFFMLRLKARFSATKRLDNYVQKTQ